MDAGEVKVERFVFPRTGGSVRVVMIDGEPWFVMADIAKILGYRDAEKVKRLLRDTQYGTLPEGTWRDLGGYGSAPLIVTEGGLYRLIMRSNMTIVAEFQDWVTDDVLPQIRKTGSYGEPKLPNLDTHEGRIQILELAMAAEKRAMQAEAKIKELEPEALRAQQTMDAEGGKLLRNVAKRFGMGEKRLREFLYDQKLLIRKGDSRNEPYAAYVKSGHFLVKTRLIHRGMDQPPEYASTTLVTGKGEKLIWKRLYEGGFVRSKTMPAEQLELS